MLELFTNIETNLSTSTQYLFWKDFENTTSDCGQLLGMSDVPEIIDRSVKVFWREMDQKPGYV